MSFIKTKSSFILIYLLYLRVTECDVVDVICAPVGSDVTLNSTCSRLHGSPSNMGSWIQISDNKSKYIDMKSPHKYRRKDTEHMCTLTILNLKKRDAGRYSYGLTQRPESVVKHFTVYVTDVQVNVDVNKMTEGQNITLICHTSCPSNTQSFIWFKNTQRLQHFRNKLSFNPFRSEDTDRYSCALQHYKSFSSAERFLHVSYVMIDSTGIIILSSLLVLLTLMLIGAAVWRKRKKLRRREGNESNTQAVNHSSYTYIVYENIPAAPSKTIHVKKREEFDHEDEDQFSYVDFSIFLNDQT